MTVDAGITVSDIDNLNLASATVSISAASFFAGDVLATSTTGTSIAQSYNATSGVLTLTGSDTLAHYRSVLDLVSYSSTATDPTNGGTDKTRGIAFTASDGISTSTAVSDTVDVSDFTLKPSGTTASYNELGGAVTIDATLTVSDPGITDLTSATVAIGTGFLATDVLGDNTSGTSITASYNSASGMLILSGSDTAAHYQSVLNSVTYSSTVVDARNEGSNPTRAIGINATDTAGNLATASETVTILDQPPSLTVGGGATPNFDAGVSLVAVDPGITVSDIDNLNLASATVSISSASFFAGDVLTANTSGTAIAFSYNATTGVLTLSGSDTLADYQAVLRRVEFSSTATDPTNGGTDLNRTISFTANDGISTSTAVSDTVNVFDFVLSPSGTTASYNELGSAVTIVGSLTVSDPGVTDLTGAEVGISGGHLSTDVLAASTAGTSITASYNPTSGILVLTGTDTLAHYQSVLDSVTYSSTVVDASAEGTDTIRMIEISATDTSNGGSLARETVAILDQPPSLTVGTTVSYTEQGPAVTLDSGLSVTDVDNLNLASATVSISAASFFAGDILAATTTGTSIAQSYNSSSGVLTLTGSDTLAHYQSVLESVTFSSSVADTRNDGANPSRTIDWTASDGISTSALATSTVNIPDAPPAVTAGATVSYTEQGAAVTLDSTLTVTDIDSINLASATVSISAASFFAGDILAATTTGTSISQSYNGTSGVLTLTGSDSVAHYKSVLESVTFSSSVADTRNEGANPSRTIDWTASDGTSSSTVATSTVNIPDEAPTLRCGDDVSYTELGPGGDARLHPELTDIDNSRISRVRRSRSCRDLRRGRRAGGNDQRHRHHRELQRASGVLTLSGTDTLADYKAVLQSVTFSSTNPDTRNFGADPEPDARLDGERRHLGEHRRHQHGQHPRCAADDRSRAPPRPTSRAAPPALRSMRRSR